MSNLLILCIVFTCAASAAAISAKSPASETQTPSSAIVFEPQVTLRASYSNNTSPSSQQKTDIRSNYYYDEESKRAAGYLSNTAGSVGSPSSESQTSGSQSQYNPSSGYSTQYNPSSGSQSNHNPSSGYQSQYNPSSGSHSQYNPSNSQSQFERPINSYPSSSSTPQQHVVSHTKPQANYAGSVSPAYSVPNYPQVNNPQSSTYQYESRPVANAGGYNVPISTTNNNANYNTGSNSEYQRPPVTSSSGHVNPLQIPLTSEQNYGSGSKESPYQYESNRPHNLQSANNYNIPTQSSQVNNEDNRYPILVSSSSNLQHPETQRPVLEHSPSGSYDKTDRPSYEFVRPDDIAPVADCPCVAASHCPTLSTRIVTPDEVPCERSDDVRCCVPKIDLPPQKCGIRKNITLPDVAVRPGQAWFGEHPWSVVLLSADNEYVGGGALLDDMHVLTAAHKVHQYIGNLQGIKVRLGEWDAAANHEPYSYLEFPVRDVAVFPEFNAKNLHGDVAVVTFAGSADLRQYPHINSVCLPRQGERFLGLRCWVAGWGQDAFGTDGAYQRIIKHVDVPIISGDECEARLRDTKLSQYFQLDRRSFICAGGEPQKDACTGDGGSPMVCEDPESRQFYVAGLVAWGIGCATHGIPGVYVNVAGYSDWIIEHTANFKHLKY